MPAAVVATLAPASAVVRRKLRLVRSFMSVGIVGFLPWRPFSVRYAASTITASPTAKCFGGSHLDRSDEAIY
jgi:hypothetical protein